MAGGKVRVRRRQEPGRSESPPQCGGKESRSGTDNWNLVGEGTVCLGLHSLRKASKDRLPPAPPPGAINHLIHAPGTYGQ